MDAIDKFCITLHSAAWIPVQVFHNHIRTVKLPAEDNFDLIECFHHVLQYQNKPLCCMRSDNHAYYGLIHNGETEIYMGPVFTTPVSKKSLPSILHESSISLDWSDRAWEYFCRLPVLTYQQFIAFLSLLYQALNGEFPNDELLPPDGMTNTENEQSVSRSYSYALYNIKEDEAFHNSYTFEQEFYGYIRDGNINGLKNMMGNPLYLKEGIVAYNPLRQAQSIFVSTITLMARYSMAGGLDVETAYNLADAYLRQVEQIADILSIQQLTQSATYDFAKRVADTHIGTSIPGDISQCIEYIQNHTNCSIALHDIGEYVHKNPTYLSQKFKKELGFTISKFITRAKLEEAKSLLAYTDKSISEISEYLCFSSQSYFQNVFRNQYNLTPKQYRMKQNNTQNNPFI